MDAGHKAIGKLAFGSLVVIALLMGVRMYASDRHESEGESNEATSGLMIAKLGNMQRVMAGLVSRDYSEIQRGAEEMLKICDSQQWSSHGDPVYTQHRAELRRQSYKLMQLAESRNLDGASFAYVQSFSTCISCHDHCRDVLRIADSKPTSRVIPIPTTDEPANWSSMPVLKR
jgi:hypothetical protein